MQAPVDGEGGSHLEPESTTVKDAAGLIGSALLVVIALSVDELNPVKILCGYTFGLLGEHHVALLALLSLLVLLIDQRDHILYHTIRLFFRCTLNNMFFRSVEIVGIENVPKGGPLILTGNHNNQFVDGILLLTNTHREISFMIAQKSWERPLVGFLARAFHCIPVARPQDLAFAGAGKVTVDSSDTVRGVGTRFTSQAKPGMQLEISGQAGKSGKVKAVVSDTELTLEAPWEGEPKSATGYKLVPKVDQSAMYDTVYSGLRRGKCLGIFPEGGSHDRTDLLPLKAGVAIIALDAYSKHHINVPIVPVGLNYFHGHHFGGRVVIEFGEPIKIPETILAQHETDRRGSIEALLQLIAVGMRGVIVPTPDYHSLQQIYMMRRLYVPEGLRLSTERAMDLNRRFAVGAQRILQLAKRASEAADAASASASTAGEGSEEPAQPVLTQDEIAAIEDLRKDLDAYMALLKKHGLKDHQVRQIGWWTVGDLIGRLLYLVVTLGLGAIPQLIFNLPVGFIAGRLAVTEQKKSLKSSTVKLAARDVVMSYKVIYVLVLVPCLYLIYGVLLVSLTNLTATSITLILAFLPVFGFLGMKASEQGIKAYADLVPLFARLLPQSRRSQDTLPARRFALQRKLLQVVKICGPKLGDLYRQRDVDWIKELSSLSHSNSSADIVGNWQGGEKSPQKGHSEGDTRKSPSGGKKAE